MSDLKRSQRPEVRNPLMRLPAAHMLLLFLQNHLEVQQQLATLLHQLGAQADQQAEQSWSRRKAPIAAYWRAVAVYARHFARALTTKGDH